LVQSGGWEIQLTRAELAFGPLYLCAGEKAGELCDVAKAEWVDSAVVNALDPQGHKVGALHGTAGETRSFMYDLGIVSMLTQKQPLVLDSAERLDGASVVVEGTARRDDIGYPFALKLAIAQGPDTEVGVPVVRKKLTDEFEHTLAEGQRLRLQFDATTWVEDIDFQAIYDEAGCTGTCEEQTPTGDTQAARALRNSLLVRFRPAFLWR